MASMLILALVEQTGACGYIVNTEGTRVIHYFQRKQTWRVNELLIELSK